MAQFTILVMCTGNICRSPLAELLLRQALADLPVTTHSAGTQALVGRPMPDPQLDIARDLEIETPDEHRAQQLTLDHVENADLILAMGREHRSEAVRFTPKVLRKAFTLRELARITEVVAGEDLIFEEKEDVVTRLRRTVEAAALNRGLALPAEHPEDDDVVDPYKRSQQTYLESRDQLVPAVHKVTAYLRRAAI
ncbi:MAG: low molecular weight phosphatase family protein [Yaniella sp.]|nr:low molecular weight phosphatase family protein [Yaniella sp.]MDN6638376.1 low molecular weight phosphatase family protein [Yaniella sp.]MDN6679933.1 low molecular weight phosphatase family protein [Yaniella sp.]